MPSTLARSPSSAAAAAPYSSSTSAMEPAAAIASSQADAAAADEGAELDDSVAHLSLSPDPLAIPRRLPSGSRIRAKGSFTSYHKPIRAETPRSSASTPNQSLREHSITSTTPTDDASDTGIIAIGMALGSPTHPPDYKMTPWAPTFTPTVTTTVEAQSPSRDEPSRSKSRKWGFFTRSRSKRGRDTKHDDQPASTPSSSGSHIRTTPTSAPDTRDALLSPRQHRPLIKTQTDPTLARGASASPLARNAADLPGLIRKDTREIFQASPFSPMLPSDNLLDVEIPDVTMERYSVMFGHLLENRSTTSLLARRQATRDRLKAIKEGEAPAQQSAAGPSSSPAIVISGTTVSPLHLSPQQLSPGPRLSPRQRSNTFPAMLPSPSHSDSEAQQASQGQATTLQHIAASTRRGSGRDKAPRGGPSLAGQPRLISKFHRRSSSQPQQGPTPKSAVGKMSPFADDGRIQAGRSPGSQHQVSPKTWNTTHPPRSESTPRSVPSPADRTSPPASPAGSGAADADAAEADADAEPDKACDDPVEVSIARQISVSRQQRAMLGPLQKQLLDSRRLNETKSATPRVIDPRRDPDSPQLMHRKSSRVVVEGA
ncbi:hypothetical protein CDD83_7023 [Cordyceps sp. RAO-2017]|nr:hypothetical protein CDD83_7023 [Cordyceps sp. RAO-2017]